MTRVSVIYYCVEHCFLGAKNGACRRCTTFAFVSPKRVDFDDYLGLVRMGTICCEIIVGFFKPFFNVHVQHLG